MKILTLVLLVTFGNAAIGNSAEIAFDLKRSRIEVHVKATGHDFSGVLNNYKAVATIDDQLNPTSGKLDWDFCDLKTGNDKRDRKMIEWISPNLTKASFTFSKWRILEDGRTLVEGEMNIHGVKKKVRFPVTLRRTGLEISVTGSAVVDHTDFQLPIISFLAFLKVDPRITVTFTMKGKLKEK